MLLPTLAANLIVLLACNLQVADAWWLFADQPAPSAALTTVNKAVATFDMDGVKGTFKFSQPTANGPTECQYNLSGLKGNNRNFHVHVKPVPQFDPELVRNNATILAGLCADPATGGHLNPHHVTAKLPPKSAPLDQYEIGDLSGKHGQLLEASSGGDPDRYVGSFTDGHLPLTGDHGIIGRSIVIHKNDGKRWVCANIVEDK